MQFIDEAHIYVKAGDGGSGAISFRREKFVPKGGPDGGNGGRGGSVLIRAEKQLNTLLDFKYKRRYFGERGENGRGKNQEGKSGLDETLLVPCGTVVRDAATKRIVCDLVQHGDATVLAKGGRGGRGNAMFATSTNQAPRVAEAGTKGQERELLLELKLLADVGLVGFPNAGKSTLISVISAAKPKIADYPFTTLVPNLGIVRVAEGKSFTVADIPGLIEGAHAGKGLGIRFLRHIERTKLLVFLIEATSDNPRRDYEVLLNELAAYRPGLAKRRKLVALTKVDLVSEQGRSGLQKLTFPRGVKTHLVSAVAGSGVEELVASMWHRLESRIS